MFISKKELNSLKENIKSLNSTFGNIQENIEGLRKFINNQLGGINGSLSRRAIAEQFAKDRIEGFERFLNVDWFEKTTTDKGYKKSNKRKLAIESKSVVGPVKIRKISK